VVVVQDDARFSRDAGNVPGPGDGPGPGPGNGPGPGDGSLGPGPGLFAGPGPGLWDGRGVLVFYGCRVVKVLVQRIGACYSQRLCSDFVGSFEL
jgi:hypothetical protein